jgi:hypothetical protein
MRRQLVRPVRPGPDDPSVEVRTRPGLWARPAHQQVETTTVTYRKVIGEQEGRDVPTN